MYCILESKLKIEFKDIIKKKKTPITHTAQTTTETFFSITLHYENYM